MRLLIAAAIAMLATNAVAQMQPRLSGDAGVGGVPRLQIAPIHWTDDGWPELGAARQ